jgi:L-amino acid N-acyltransferase YncA
MTPRDPDPVDYRPVPLVKGHVEQMLRVFNHYVAEGYAAYPEHPVSKDTMIALLRRASGYPAIAVEGPGSAFLGFGFLCPYSPGETFSCTAVVVYFVDEARVRQGIGTAILRQLEEEARTKGITGILAHISSRNEVSLAFHAKHGFTECGRFPGIGRKKGTPFDVVWVVKLL